LVRLAKKRKGGEKERNANFENGKKKKEGDITIIIS